MKKMMLGNEAIARGMYEAGVRFVSSYPGTPSTEITEEAVKFKDIYCEWAPNEKVGLEAAFGASLAGGRSAACMKHVGLNVAADPLFTISYTGVNGGLVLFVADDPNMHSSQNEQDSRHYAVAAKVPMIEASDPAEAKVFTKAAYELSEKFDTPVMFRTCTRIAHQQCAVDEEPRLSQPIREYVKNPQKYIMAPANAVRRHPEVEARMKALQEYAYDCGLNRIERGKDNRLGIITSGTCYEYVKEVFGDDVSVLKLGLIHPISDRLVREFAASVERLVVMEELDPVIENFVKALGILCEGKSLFPIVGEFSQDTVREAFGLLKPACFTAPEIPGRPPVMCAGCPHRGLFYILAKNKYTVIGDIGCYTLGSTPPLQAVDSVLCMGASVSGIHGFNSVRREDAAHKTVAVIGDSTFMHSGMTGLANIAYNGSDSTVIILDNSITGMTGHQNNPTNGCRIDGAPTTKIDLEALVHALGIRRVSVIDPFDLKASEEVIRREVMVPEASVIISRRPCALLKSTKKEAPLYVDSNICRGCHSCMKIGCPAISFKGGTAVIDYAQCVGCGVCSELCAFDAILKGEQA